MARTLVLYPAVGAGHLNPMLALAKKLHTSSAFNVAIALITPDDIDAAAFDTAVAAAVASNPSISFHTLPSPPPPPACPQAQASFFVQYMDRLRAHTAPFLEYLRSLDSVAAVVLDFFCVDALTAAAALGIPAYFFFASGATDLAAFLHLPFLEKELGVPLGSLPADELLHCPGAPPFPASHLPSELLGEDRQPVMYFFDVAARLLDGCGILANTFEALEPDAVCALADGSCASGRAIPPVYCVGPIVAGGGEEKSGDCERHYCLEWLDGQPEKSVVLLCFGSRGTFSPEQTAELAAGLESSGQRFLWVLRRTDLEAVLPEGFLEKTKDRGMVMNSWAPQVEVLLHRATGAFVTHCGWNSTLEGITAGVPLLCWPLYAEQKMNKVFLVERMRLGVEMEGAGEGTVAAGEVAKKVRWVMEEEGGMELRARAEAARVAGEKAVERGGSSAMAIELFLDKVGGSALVDS